MALHLNSRLDFSLALGGKRSSDVSQVELPEPDVVIGKTGRPVRGWSDETVEKFVTERQQRLAQRAANGAARRAARSGKQADLS